MKKIGIFYGSSTGTTKSVAERIGKMLEVDAADIHDVAETAPSKVADYDTLVFGTSTWGSGDLQDDWYDFADGVAAMKLDGKKIALFGCGDETMTDTFCNAVGELRERFDKTGATFIGAYDVDGYKFDHSKAVDESGKAVGLLLDDVNHAELTDFRLRSWVGETF